MLPESTEKLKFRTLYKSGLVNITNYFCNSRCEVSKNEEVCPENYIVLLRGGTFDKCFGRKSFNANVNQAVFFAKDSTYRIDHPADCGDCGTVFSLSEEVLREIINKFNPAYAETPQPHFPFVTATLDSINFSRNVALIRQIEDGTFPSQPFETEILAFEIITNILKQSFEQHNKASNVRKTETASLHKEMTESAKHYFAKNLSENITLEKVTRFVNSSPYNFVRIFQSQTGITPYQYLKQLRLREAFERLSSGEDDITSMALELGFSSHSHFTSAFRNKFGATPSEIREKQRYKRFKIGKNLIV